MERRRLLAHSWSPACEAPACRRYKHSRGCARAVRDCLRYPLVAAMYKLVRTHKWGLIALAGLQWFSSAGVVSPAAGGSSNSPLTRHAGTCNYIIPGGARCAVTDMVSPVGYTAVGKCGCGVALVA